MLLPCVAQAQFTIGLGGGVGAGSRGGSESALHGAAFVQLKLPVIPGLRGEAMLIDVDSPSNTGAFSLTLNGVVTAPIPLVTPYLIAGWGTYGVGRDGSRSGWNAGIGVRASLRFGVYAEFRRHQRISRDLLTVGVTF
jgi:hypothetical protein